MAGGEGGAELGKRVEAGVRRAPRLHESTRGAPAAAVGRSAWPERHPRRAIAWIRVTCGGAAMVDSGEVGVVVEGSGLGKLPEPEVELLHGLAGAPL